MKAPFESLDLRQLPEGVELHIQRDNFTDGTHQESLVCRPSLEWKRLEEEARLRETRWLILPPCLALMLLGGCLWFASAMIPTWRSIGCSAQMQCSTVIPPTAKESK